MLPLRRKRSTMHTLASWAGRALSKRRFCLGAPALCTGLLLGCGGTPAPCTSIGCADDSAPAASSTGPQVVHDPAGVVSSFAPQQESATQLDSADICSAEALAAEASPVNLVVLLDRSVSMSEPATPGDPAAGSRWEAVTAALGAFLVRPELSNVKVGLQFFGLRNGSDDCGMEKYEQPAVAVGDLPQVRDELLSTISRTRPGSLTPTGPAVQGALRYAARVAAKPENAGRSTVLVLASDGLPSECAGMDETGASTGYLSSLVDVLEQHANPPDGTPAVRTYVLGTEELGVNARLLADAGGGKAFLIGSGNVEAQFLEAMLSIVTSPLDCQLPVPEQPVTGERLDFDRIRVRFTHAGSGRVEEFPRLAHEGQCLSNSGWFYDDPNAPQFVKLCGGTCQGLGAGQIQLEFGCAPELPR